MDTCNAGCCANDRAPYLGHCESCGREFRTGHRLATDICYECHRVMVAPMRISEDEMPWRDDADDARAFTRDRDRDRVA